MTAPTPSNTLGVNVFTAPGKEWLASGQGLSAKRSASTRSHRP